MTLEQQKLIRAIFKEKGKVTCTDLVEHWNPEWKSCPLCGSKPGIDGIFLHIVTYEPKEQH